MCCQAELGAQVKQNQQDFARTGEMLFHFHSNQIVRTDQG